jgi:hypothetical protein
MQNINAFKHLDHDVFDLVPLQRLLPLGQTLEKSILAVFEDTVNTVLLSAPLFKDVKEFNEVRVFGELLKE